MSHKSEILFIGISRMRNHINRAIDSVFRSYGLTITQFSILEVLYSKGDLCIKDIQETILGTSGNIPLVVKNLEKQGLVTKKESQTDRRVSIVHLTDKGKEIVVKVYPLQQRQLDQIFEVYDTHEQRELLKLLLKFYKNIKEEEKRV